MEQKTDIVSGAKAMHRKLDLLLKTGCLLMDCSADTTRIMRNLKRTTRFLGLDDDKLCLHVNYNVLMLNYTDGDATYTKFQRCDRHGIDMNAIARVSRLTCRAEKDTLSVDDYEAQLKAIASAPRKYTPWQVAVGAGFACGGFCIQFGCDWPAFFYASIAAILGFRLRMYLGAKGANTYVCVGIAAFVATIVAWLTSFLSTGSVAASLIPSWMHSSTPWHPLMACALFIVPGVPLINSVSDILGGHLQTGLIRGLNTLLTVVAMAFGIAFAIDICGIDNFVRDLSMIPHHTYMEFAIAAAISAMGFSTIYNIPRKMLPVVAVGGIIAVCTRNFVNLGASTDNFGLDMGPIAGSLAGSTMISLVCIQLRHWVHTPHQCLSIPSVIPMIPGVLMYRSLFAFIEMHGVVGEVTVGMYNFMLASLIILVIAIGVSIPNIFVRRLLRTQ